MNEILIYLVTFEFYVMYFLIMSQDKRTVEEIFYDHNVENVTLKL